jgi:ubiquinone/menaquinone biosynthesis C-methylase UbiE
MTSINLIETDHGHARFVRGDACAMPFESNSYDYVFSNAVIEHVGRYDRQQMMADEIRRVARKGYFVATPNRWFPIDPHSYLLFFHLMPLGVRRLMNPRDDYFMLSPAKMRSLFPEASVVLTPDGTSVIAIARLSGQVTATRTAAAGAR